MFGRPAGRLCRWSTGALLAAGRRRRSSQARSQALHIPQIYPNSKYENDVLDGVRCERRLDRGYSDGARDLLGLLQRQDMQITTHLHKTRHISHPALKLIR